MKISCFNGFRNTVSRITDRKYVGSGSADRLECEANENEQKLAYERRGCRTEIGGYPMTEGKAAAIDPPADAAQLQQLYTQYARELWAIFYSICGDPERAQDAVQESFLKLQGYQGEQIRDARAWLLRVGQNWLRDQARRRVNSCVLLPGLDDQARQQMSADELLALGERQSQIRAALAELSEEDRKVLVMKYSMDWSSAQMGQVLDCTAAAVDMRLSRARRRLAGILEQRGIGND